MSVLKYPRTFHWTSSPGLQNDDRVTQSPNMLINVPVIITEKLDGGNTCLYKGEVYARSTGQPSTAGWFSMVRKHHAWKTTTVNDWIFYGEDLYGVHSISYGAMAENKTFRLFALRKPNGGFADWSTVKKMADSMDMETVPVLFEGKFKSDKELSDWFKNNIKEPSSLGGEREGFVVRHSGLILEDEFAYLVAKYVRAGHVQTDAHWTKNWKPCKIIR